MVRELNFTLEGVQGDLKLEYGPFKQRLYQDGRDKDDSIRNTM